MRERRRFVRVRVRLGASVAVPANPPDPLPSVPGSVLGTVAPGEIENPSSGGLLLSTQQPLPAGVIVHLEIQLPEAETPVRAWGRIVWAADDDLGIEILRITPRDQDKINRLVAAHLASASGDKADL